MQCKEPTFSNNRCFVSPIVGCTGQCLYCYLAINDYREPSPNLYGINKTISFLEQHKNFVSGKAGTIISIGAWGDLFPPNSSLRKYSIDWIKKLLKLGNPVQVMSKNKLTEAEIEEIVTSIVYPNQLLYSTTIVTFEYSNVVERGVSSPKNRINMLERFSERGVPTNIMIKPFIPGITDVENFIKYICPIKVPYCVVGKLYLDDNIFENLQKVPIIKNIIEKTNFDDVGQIGCVGEKELRTFADSAINAFISRLQESHIQVFKKSSCVSSNILGVENKSVKTYRAKGCCMQCGNCSL